MKTLLSLLMERLHSLESPVIAHRDAASFPAGELDRLIRNGLLRLASDPEEIPHPNGCSGRRVTVRRTESGFVACPCEDDPFFPPFPLSPDQVRHYEVSVPRLVERLRKDCGIVGDGASTDHGLQTIGQKHIDGFGAVDVYLSLPNYDLVAFTSRCLALRKPRGTKCILVLVPLPVSLPPVHREALESRDVILFPLLPLADRGELVIDWEAAIVRSEAARRPDGANARMIIFRGREYSCDLTKREVEFLNIALTCDPVPIERVWHRGKDALWRSKFVNEKQNRDRISRFLSDLNEKLARTTPPYPFLFSLSRGEQVIVRTSESAD